MVLRCERTYYSEAAIFNAFDSERGQRLAVPHCSSDLAEAGSGIPRQSIEVRAFVFYSCLDLDYGIWKMLRKGRVYSSSHYRMLLWQFQKNVILRVFNFRPLCFYEDLIVSSNIGYMPAV